MERSQKNSALTRRDVLVRAAGLAGAAAAASLGAASAVRADEKPAPSKGRIKQSVCRWCYGKIDLDTLCKEAARMGYKGIDLVGPSEWATVKKHGLVPTMVPGAGSIPDGFNRTENHDRLIAEMKKNIDLAAEAGCPNVICFSGNRKGQADDVGLKNCIEGLKRVAGYAEEKKVTINVELLNSKVDHHDYQLDHCPWGVEMMKGVSSPRVKLLYDIYHMQIMEGDVIRTIRQNIQYLGHFHTGGNPGRNEIDDTQELNYGAVMRAIAELPFNDYVAQEFIPRKSEDALKSMEEAFKICDV